MLVTVHGLLYALIITLFNSVTMLGRVGNMPYKVLKLYLMNACVSVNSGEALSLNIILDGTADNN